MKVNLINEQKPVRFDEIQIGTNFVLNEDLLEGDVEVFTKIPRGIKQSGLEINVLRWSESFDIKNRLCKIPDNAPVHPVNVLSVDIKRIGV